MKTLLTVCAALVIGTASAQFQFSNKDYKNKDLDWMGMITFDYDLD
ncbi:MAG: hypothetical protein ACI83W_000997 [Marinoscillum sp.]|jgi:hypothetical protein